ncbi:MAG TPA: hypothetical protein DEB24_03350 [Coriobacteriia bacterium]|nr:hypothetical protein [Coriobacteriia bacterium]
MTLRKTSLSRAFFLELVLVFVIFAVCSIICLQVFAASEQERIRSLAMTELGITSQRIAEAFKADGGDINGSDLVDSAERVGSLYVWSYDKDLNVVEREEAYFTLTFEAAGSDKTNRVEVATITLSEGSSELFSYDVGVSMSGAVR